MVYKFIAMGCAAIIASLAACSDDASPSASVIPAETSSSFVIPASSGNLLSSSSESAIESSATSSSSADAQSSSSMAVQTSSSSETASSSSATVSSSSTGASSSNSAETASSSSAGPVAEYLWNDEFDGESIDLTKWTFDIGTGSSGWGNNEWEYYTDRKENAYVKDGVLHIRAQKEDYEGQKCTSARMELGNGGSRLSVVRPLSVDA